MEAAPHKIAAILPLTTLEEIRRRGNRKNLIRAYLYFDLLRKFWPTSCVTHVWGPTNTAGVGVTQILELKILRFTYIPGRLIWYYLRFIPYNISESTRIPRHIHYAETPRYTHTHSLTYMHYYVVCATRDRNSATSHLRTCWVVAEAHTPWDGLAWWLFRAVLALDCICLQIQVRLFTLVSVPTLSTVFSVE